MNNYDCGICMDLMPLVHDAIASDESTEFVSHHIKDCDNCRRAYESNEAQVAPPMNAKKIGKRIRRSLSIILFAILITGTLVGIGFSSNQNVFLNLIFMPVIGAGMYVLLGKKAAYVPAAVFGVSFIFVTFSAGLDISDALYFSVIYAVLSALGILISFLLRYAFKKEDKV